MMARLGVTPGPAEAEEPLAGGIWRRVEETATTGIRAECGWDGSGWKPKAVDRNREHCSGIGRPIPAEDGFHAVWQPVAVRIGIRRSIAAIEIVASGPSCERIAFVRLWWTPT